jgi:hypothetical protein
VEAALEAVLAVILQVVQMTGASAATTETVATVVNALVKLIPVVLDIAPKLISTVKNIIAALEANPATLPDQIATLKAALPADDADFDSAAQQAEANDTAAAAAEADPKS